MFKIVWSVIKLVLGNLVECISVDKQITLHNGVDVWRLHKYALKYAK